MVGRPRAARTSGPGFAGFFSSEPIPEGIGSLGFPSLRQRKSVRFEPVRLLSSPLGRSSEVVAAVGPMQCTLCLTREQRDQPCRLPCGPVLHLCSPFYRASTQKANCARINASTSRKCEVCFAPCFVAAQTAKQRTAPAHVLGSVPWRNRRQTARQALRSSCCGSSSLAIWPGATVQPCEFAKTARSISAGVFQSWP